MAGQVIKRGDRAYLVRIFMGRDSNGKQRFHRKTIHGTKKDAEKYRNKIATERDLGTFVEPSLMGVDEYLDKWLEAAARPRLHERTFADYRELLKRYVRPELGSRKLSSVRALDIQALYSGMQQRGLSARTVRITHVVLSNALRQAVRWGMISVNHAQNAELPKRARKEMTVMTLEEVNRFLEAAKADAHSLIFPFALATGMRPEEYLALQWKDLDLINGKATVQRTLCWRRAKGGGWYFGPPKTQHSRRTIPLPGSLLIDVRRHKAQQAERRLKCGSEYQGWDLVFATATGGPLHPDNLNARNFKAACKRAEMSPKFSLYILRHTCATLLLLAGVNPKIVAERLGHSSIAITLDIYSHVLPSMQQIAADELENMLFRKAVTQ
ncbi:MAG TPA: site-specific integrase [Blastocatellia bacterium]|jgi:integrase|nr:site-specific integrase [Blastocatellia bacterium]